MTFEAKSMNLFESAAQLAEAQCLLMGIPVKRKFTDEQLEPFKDQILKAQEQLEGV